MDLSWSVPLLISLHCLQLILMVSHVSNSWCASVSNLAPWFQQMLFPDFEDETNTDCFKGMINIKIIICPLSCCSYLYDFLFFMKHRMTESVS